MTLKLKTLNLILLLFCLIGVPAFGLRAMESPEQEQVVQETQQCLLCLDEKPVDGFYRLSCCGYNICNECVESFLISATTDKGILVCPNFECKKKIKSKELDRIAAAIGGAELVSTVDKLKSMLSTESDAGVVEESVESKKLNETWKKKHSKECPKCKTAIEKNDGCDHMTCKSCAHEFCWLCLRDRSEGLHICRTPGSVVSRARAVLDRVDHGFHRILPRPLSVRNTTVLRDHVELRNCFILLLVSSVLHQLRLNFPDQRDPVFGQKIWEFEGVYTPDPRVYYILTFYPVMVDRLVRMIFDRFI